MKLRGKVSDAQSIKQFAQLAHTLARVGKQIILRISETQLIFILSEKETKLSAVTAWAEFMTEKLFSEFTMEGLSSCDNEICLEIHSDLIVPMLHGLKISQNLISLKLKLTKRQGPCLTFEIETSTINSSNVCVHDVPISVVSKKNWPDYKIPDLPNFNISLTMPEMKVVRQSLERLKSVGGSLSIIAKLVADNSDNCILLLTAESLSVKSSVTFTDLRKINIDDTENNSFSHNQNGADEFKVDVELKTLMQVVPTESIKSCTSICSIISDKMIHLLYIIGDGTLQYCIPAKSGNDD